MSGLSEGRLIYAIWPVMVFGTYSKVFAELSRDYPDAEGLYAAVTNDSGVRKRIPEDIIKKADGTPLSKAEEVLELCGRKNIKIVCAGDEDYPARLRSVYDPPSLLFYRGDISSLNTNPNIACVGTRNPSDYSRRAAGAIVRSLSKLGFDIISGFAEGIDICCHLAAIKSGGRTYAVIGSGIDYEYPKANMQYAHLIEENGAIISEYLPGSSSCPANFPRRNRILTGISMSLAVIEAGKKSGSLNSAAHAAEQGRTVFAVPPSDILDPRYAGNAALIRDGAVPLMAVRDVVNEYGALPVHIIGANRATPGENSKTKKENIPEETENKSSPVWDIPQSDARSLAQSVPDALGKSIILALDGKTMRADDLSAELETDIGEILTALTLLEIDGVIHSVGGNYSLV